MRLTNPRGLALIDRAWTELAPKIARWTFSLALTYVEPISQADASLLNVQLSAATRLLSSAEKLRVLSLSRCANMAHLLKLAAADRSATLRALHVVAHDYSLSDLSCISQLRALEDLQIHLAEGHNNQAFSAPSWSCILPHLRALTLTINLYVGDEAGMLFLSRCIFNSLQRVTIEISGRSMKSFHALHMCDFFRRHEHVPSVQLRLGPTKREEPYERLLTTIQCSRFGLLQWFPPEWADMCSPRVDVLELGFRPPPDIGRFPNRKRHWARSRLARPYGLLERIAARSAAGLAVPRRIILQYGKRAFPVLSWRYWASNGTDSDQSTACLNHICIMLALAIRLRRHGIHLVDEEGIASQSCFTEPVSRADELSLARHLTKSRRNEQILITSGYCRLIIGLA
jgi:hypothetical protein